MNKLNRIFLVCMLLVVMVSGNALASRYTLFRGNSNGPAAVGILSIYGETSSIHCVDNYQSEYNGTVKAIAISSSISITYNAGFGITEYPVPGSNIVYMYSNGGSLYAECPTFPDLEIDLNRNEFRNNFKNMLQSYAPQAYNILQGNVSVMPSPEQAIAHVNEPQVAAAPADNFTPASDYINEKYWDGNYIISYEDSQKTANKHGKYRYHTTDNKIGRSFDYDNATQTFTDYLCGGLAGSKHYNEVDEFTQPYNRALLTMPFSDACIGQTIYTDGNETWQVSLYPEVDNSHLPAMWYKLTEVDDDTEWYAFTYDKTTNTFTLYRPENHGGVTQIIVPDTLKFLDDNRIELHDVEKNGEYDDILVVNDMDWYIGENTGVNLPRYVTKGFRLFRQRTQNK